MDVPRNLRLIHPVNINSRTRRPPATRIATIGFRRRKPGDLCSSDGKPFCRDERCRPNFIAVSDFFVYTGAVKFLTRQEQLVLAVVLGLLLTGLCAKYYRSGHPAQTAALQQSK